MVVGAILTNYQDVRDDEAHSDLVGDDLELAKAMANLETVLAKRKNTLADSTKAAAADEPTSSS